MNTANKIIGANFDSLPWNDDGGTVYHKRGSHYVVIFCCKEDPGTPVDLHDINRLKTMLEVIQQETEREHQ